MAARPIGDVLAEQVRRYRQKQGLKQEDIARRTADYGHRLSQVTLAKLEAAGGTRAAGASLVDVLVLAAALDVPPPLLFLPLGDDELVEVAPGLRMHPHIALDWIAGKTDHQGHDPLGGPWMENSQRIRLFNGLRERQEAVHRAQDALAADAQRPFDPSDPEEAEQAHAAALAVMAFDGPDERFRRVDQALGELAVWMDAMRAAGVTQLPQLHEVWQARMAKLAADD